VTSALNLLNSNYLRHLLNRRFPSFEAHDVRTSGGMKTLSHYAGQWKWAYNHAVFKVKREIPGKELFNV